MAELNEADELLTVEEAARVVRLSRSSVYDACDGKRLAHHRLSGSGRRGKIVIWRSDLLDWIDSCRVEAEGGPKSPAPAKKVALPSLDLD